MVKRLSIFVYGVVSYAVFFATFLYAVGFIGNLWVPKSMDSVREVPFLTALLTDLGLARPVRRPAQRDGPAGVQAVVDPHRPGGRGAQHLCAVLQPGADPAVRYWQPLGGVVWDVSSPLGQAVLYAAFAFGWLLVLVSTFLINHFDLFGLRQVWLQLLGKPYTAAAVRHAGALPLRAPPAVRRLVLRLLGDADHDRRAPGVRDRHDGLHPDRDPARGARPDRRASRVRELPSQRADAGAVHQAPAAGSQRIASAVQPR